MSTPPEAATLIAAVEKSPAAVAVHDREGWLGLFSHDAEVCDPVGSRPNHGRAELTAFYETFIAPNDITFHVEHDTVAGMTVFRDLTLETVMGGRSGPGGTTAPGDVALRVPMHLRYDVVDVGGEGRTEDLRLELLHAHWELPSMIGQLLEHGVVGAGVGAKLVPRLLRNQRVGGTVGFGRALRRAGREGKSTLEDLLGALSSGDGAGARRRLAPDTPIELPGTGRSMPAEEFAGTPRGLRWRKLLSAGMTVTATIESDGARGVGLFEFDGRRDRVSRARLFLPR
ncbi:nuclear transport factor 2 family protein [Tomitella fengzijianii]|uniref:Transporter n=1 Tax=Tomitella fengzijianii TaxID=2597660 RepID=A0A516X6I5_9ACTN|nr:nuclear transport factor 2 family protein [Tomitella fengzijianii]QDQ98623.1 transporter [Tomitella fengzijianii]